MNVIGRRTVNLADLGPRSVSVCGPGRPKFIIAEEPLENLKKKTNQIKSNQNLFATENTMILAT